MSCLLLCHSSKWYWIETLTILWSSNHFRHSMVFLKYCKHSVSTASENIDLPGQPQVLWQCQRRRIWVPTRLIDCHKLETGSDSVNLIETAKVNVSGPTMTVSHSWDDRNILMLTRTTLRGNNTYIPEQSLPQSLHDARDVARELGVRHCRIDCLYTLQDSSDDFQPKSMVSERSQRCLS